MKLGWSRVFFAVSAMLAFLGQTDDNDGVPRWLRIGAACLSFGLAAAANREALNPARKASDKMKAPAVAPDDAP